MYNKKESDGSVFFFFLFLWRRIWAIRRIPLECETKWTQFIPFFHLICCRISGLDQWQSSAGNVCRHGHWYIPPTISHAIVPPSTPLLYIYCEILFRAKCYLVNGPSSSFIRKLSVEIRSNGGSCRRDQPGPLVTDKFPPSYYPRFWLIETFCPGFVCCWASFRARH